MKKTLLVTALALLLSAASPAFAGGYWKASSNGDNVGDDLADGIVWLVKLPFRVVTTAVGGVHGIIADQDLEGFEEGYNWID